MIVKENGKTLSEYNLLISDITELFKDSTGYYLKYSSRKLEVELSESEEEILNQFFIVSDVLDGDSISCENLKVYKSNFTIK